MIAFAGERPFVCKVCNMSFTTNGNMHRHSRIHTKEENLKSLGAQFQVRRGKPAWRQRVSNFLQQQQKMTSPPTTPKSFHASMHKDILKNLPNHSQHSVFSRPGDVTALQVPQPLTGVKRQLSGTDLAADWPVPAKRPSLEASESDRDSGSPKKSTQQFSSIKTEVSETHDQQEVSHHEPVCYRLLTQKAEVCGIAIFWYHSL